MFILRFLLWVIALPVLLIAHLLSFIVSIFVCLGDFVARAIGSVCILTGIWMLAKGMGEFILMILGGIAFLIAPRLGTLTLTALVSFTDWLKETVYGR